MFTIPRPLKKLIESFEKLPGVGSKTAQRLTFYLLHVPQSQLDEFAEALTNLKKSTILCAKCFNVSETSPCDICKALDRNEKIICVVEQPLDLIALEKTGTYKGLYHVLHGAISPINNIGPEEIYLEQLLTRLKTENITELIIATNPSMEGEATAMFINNEVNKLRVVLPTTGLAGYGLEKLKITRIARGLPTGGDLEYADDMTLIRAMEGRQTY